MVICDSEHRNGLVFYFFRAQSIEPIFNGTTSVILKNVTFVSEGQVGMLLHDSNIML